MKRILSLVLASLLLLAAVAALAEGLNPLILALDDHLPAYGERRTLPLGTDAESMARAIFAAPYF